MGKIKEITVIDIWQQNINDLAVVTSMRIVNTDDRIYYMLYNQTWGLEAITKVSENGEIIYDSLMFTIKDGLLCELEWIYLVL